MWACFETGDLVQEGMHGFDYTTMPPGTKLSWLYNGKKSHYIVTEYTLAKVRTFVGKGNSLIIDFEPAPMGWAIIVEPAVHFWDSGMDD